MVDPDRKPKLFLYSKRKTIEDHYEKFKVRLPNDQACFDWLHQTLLQTGLLRCDGCNSANLSRAPGHRNMRCIDCHRLCSITANTCMRGLQNVHTFMFIIDLEESGLTVSSSMLHEVTGISQSSGLEMLRKIRAVMAEQMENESCTLVSSAMFYFLFGKRSTETPARVHPQNEQEVVDQESNGSSDSSTGANGHQSHGAQSETNAGAAAADARRTGNTQDPNSTAGAADQPDCASNFSQDRSSSTFARSELNDLLDRLHESAATEHASVTSTQVQQLEPKLAEEIAHISILYSGPELDENAKLVYSHLSDEPVYFDALCERTKLPSEQLAAACTMLEISGLALRRPGNKYTRQSDFRKPADQQKRTATLTGLRITAEIMKMVQAAIEFVCQTYQRISRKYLQTYIAEYWYHKKGSASRSETLLMSCLRSKAITYDEITKQVTPPNVRM